MLYTLRYFFSSKCSLFYNANLFGSCIIHILYTGCAEIKKKNNSGAKGLTPFRLSVRRRVIMMMIRRYENPQDFENKVTLRLLEPCSNYWPHCSGKYRQMVLFNAVRGSANVYITSVTGHLA